MCNLNAVSDGVRVAYFLPLLPSHLKFFKWNWRRLSFDSYTLDGIEITPIFYIPRLARNYPRLDIKLKYLAFRCFTGGIGHSSEKIHSIFSQTAFPDGPIANRIAKAMGISYTVALRGSDIHTFSKNNPVVKKGVEKILSEARKVVAVSDVLRNTAKDIFKRDHVDEILYTTCDVDLFDGQRKPQLPLLNWYYVGAIFKAKGVFELLEAFISVRKKGMNVKLTMIGDGPDSEAFRLDAAKESVLDYIEFKGQVSNRSTLAHIINDQDLLVFPSYNEGLPNTVVEAVSASRAVICSQVGGVAEIARANAAYCMIEPKSSEQIVCAYLNMIEQDESKILAGLELNRKHLEFRFSPRAQQQTLKNLFLEEIK